MDQRQEALALSEKLRQLSSKKRRKECLELYRSPINAAIRDGYHGSIVVDCCARCGDIVEAENTVIDMMQANKHNKLTQQRDGHFFWLDDPLSYQKVPIQAWTALLKGYAHKGEMGKADSLFGYLCSTTPAKSILSKKRKQKHDPNVRTLNTVLRGCMWTATSQDHARSNDNGATKLIGGIMTASRAWEMAAKRKIALDTSSYEYYVTILAQSLRFETAERLIGQMKNEFEPAVLSESLAVCWVATARACLFLGRVGDASRCTRNAQMCFDRKPPIEEFTGKQGEARKRHATTGGKQSKHGTSRREHSNNLFRSHRQSELRMEVSCIEQICSNKCATLDAQFVARSMLTRLLYFSGGGTTSLDAINTDDGSEECNDFSYSLDSVWNSFGLKETLHRLIENRNATSSELRSIFPTGGKKKSNMKRSDLSLPTILDDTTCAKLQNLFAGGTIIDDTGCVDFDRIFSTGDQDEKCHGEAPLYLELGSGAGDWACLQAQLNPSGKYVTVELRADRVFQTFAKGMLRRQPLSNLCCVGSECGSFLRQRIRTGTVDTIFVNHPEPPTQTHGVKEADQSDEPAHMLNNKMIVSSAKCLKPDGRGRLIIVTDNLIYAQFICRSVSKLLSKIDLVGVAPREVHDLKRIESFGHGSLNLYEGNPSTSVDHYVLKGGASNGTSYFDRLWRTGAGKHADMKRRYIIALRTKGGMSREAGVTIATPKKRKKRSEEKQRRRNERRLKRKLESKEPIPKPT